MAVLTKRSENYPQWYQDVISNADMAENSVSPGCMVIKPWGYGIWERIQREMDDRFRATGHENCYFPMFIPISFFQKEADHVEGFAKEMAVVTHSRLAQNEDGKLEPASKLEEPLIVRPTSEAIISDCFAKWVKSYRDLPVLVNQWANVVRWEMRPRLFLRTREFLWQEGHTAHASYQEAEEEAKKMLEVYREVAEDVLAMPVILGKKPEYDKFPGAVDTYCLEPMMQDGRALQAGTSHFLGQNFAKAADIKFQNDKGELEYAYTTSWGVSTRLIGGLIMSHADDEGMQVPPRVAPYQIVVIPLIKKEEDREIVGAYAASLAKELSLKTVFGEKIRVKLDTRDKAPQDKSWEWIRKGAPLVLEIGRRDADGQNVMAKIRHLINQDGFKRIMPKEAFVQQAGVLLEQVQQTLFDRAKERLEKYTRTDIRTPEEFQAYFANGNVFLQEGSDKNVAFVRGKWSGDENSDELLKQMKLTIRCIPFDQSGTEGICLLTGKKATMDVIYARSY